MDMIQQHFPFCERNSIYKSPRATILTICTYSGRKQEHTHGGELSITCMLMCLDTMYSHDLSPILFPLLFLVLLARTSAPPILSKESLLYTWCTIHRRMLEIEDVTAACQRFLSRLVRFSPGKCIPVIRTGSDVGLTTLRDDRGGNFTSQSSLDSRPLFGIPSCCGLELLPSCACIAL